MATPSVFLDTGTHAQALLEIAGPEAEALNAEWYLDVTEAEFERATHLLALEGQFFVRPLAVQAPEEQNKRLWQVITVKLPRSRAEHCRNFLIEPLLSHLGELQWRIQASLCDPPAVWFSLEGGVGCSTPSSCRRRRSAWVCGAVPTPGPDASALAVAE